MSYYTSIIIICWLTLGALAILIYRNYRISDDSKKLLYLTYLLIAVSALAEWCGVMLDGRENLPSWILKVVKCADYTLTPMAGGALAAQMRLNNRWQKLMIWILAVNAVFQLVCAPFGWMVVVDAQNHYSHGTLFPVYLGVCFAIYALLVLQFAIYGRSFERQNRDSLYAVMLLVIVGILMQEIWSSVRTAYLGMTAGTALMFIHFTEFAQQTVDSHIARQEHDLNTDALTGLLSRYAYSRALNEYAASGVLPEGFAAYSIDLNNLKVTNDNMGHEAGDELIRGAGETITKVFGDGASCYRTGGDEFIVLTAEGGDPDAKLAGLKEASAGWEGPSGQKLEMAAGYALAKDSPELNAEELVKKADLAMYAAKAEYYRMSGHDRRRR